MTLSEHIPLSSLTTFKVGGNARYVATCENEEDIGIALAFARERARSVPWRVIGGGSNILANDAGYEGVIIRPLLQDIEWNDSHSSNECVVTAGAGVVWDALVDECAARGLWGLENLAGIPGTVGAAPVQNIGAYGAEAAASLLFVDAYDSAFGIVRRFAKSECGFGYRESRFKHDPSLIIVRVTFALRKNGVSHLDYADLASRREAGTAMDTPTLIGRAVREIRAQKFPDLSVEGTAGSFFKNPIIPTEKYDALKESFPGLPGFTVEGSLVPETKVPLAWILDHVLHLKGFSRGFVRLYEKQPIVIVAATGATAHDVDALALDIERRVLETTGIVLEREVCSL